MTAFLIIIIALALIFDYINGFHDAANSIATVVSTKVLTPLQAVVWAAFFNFIAAFTVGTAVAKTIGKGLIDPSVVDPTVILAALSFIVTFAVARLLRIWWRKRKAEEKAQDFMKVFCYFFRIVCNIDKSLDYFLGEMTQPICAS